jgi:hypothetical protein
MVNITVKCGCLFIDVFWNRLKTKHNAFWSQWLELGFPIAMDICNYTMLSAIGQVVAVTTNTLCHIQYWIYDATHMQLYATPLQLISTFDSHKFQREKWNANMAFHPFVNKWHMSTPFATYLQLFYN